MIVDRPSQAPITESEVVIFFVGEGGLVAVTFTPRPLVLDHEAHVSNNKKGPLQRPALKFVW